MGAFPAYYLTVKIASGFEYIKNKLTHKVFPGFQNELNAHTDFTFLPSGNLLCFK